MTGLASVMVLVGLFGFALLLIILIIRAIKRKYVKKISRLLLISLVIFILGIIIMPSSDKTVSQTDTTSRSQTSMTMEAFLHSETQTTTQTPAPTETPLLSETPTPIPTDTPSPTSTPTLIVYYEQDESINLYVNRFNESNPDWQFSEGELSVYYHHARYHNDQAKCYKDGYEIVINGDYDIRDVRIFIGSNKEKWSPEDYREMFVRFALPFSSDFNEDVLSDYWQQVMDDLTNHVRFNEFEVDVTMYNGHIQYMTIDGGMRKNKYQNNN